MISAPALRAIATFCLFAVGCGGAPVAGTTMAAGAVPADAPSWARSGDQKSEGGSLFVCQGEGRDEQQAIEVARGLCSAKICELCGVEVRSTVETRETLEKVEVERKVVETCRRVRKSEEEVRYRQSGCGPNGCTAWLQVFFGSEAEARECRAYAEGNFADSGQCEDLIEQFRSTADRTAESFRARAELLTRAIVACAEIDVRPTPKLTALDEILWQGVVSPRAEPRPERPIDDSQPIAERLRALAANSRDAWKSEYAQHAYKGIDRQPLLESKVFVDRIAHIRDAMVGYESIMAAFEALVDAEHAPDPAHAAALVRALRGVKPVAGKFTPERVLAWAADEISRNKKTLAQPEVKANFMEKYATSAESVAYALMGAMVSDERASEDEWQFVMKSMKGCVSCAVTLLNLPDHGNETMRVARLVELSRLVTTAPDVKALQDVNPELLLRAERALDPTVTVPVNDFDKNTARMHVSVDKARYKCAKGGGRIMLRRFWMDPSGEQWAPLRPYEVIDNLQDRLKPDGDDMVYEVIESSARFCKAGKSNLFEVVGLDEYSTVIRRNYGPSDALHRSGVEFLKCK